jgi:hypothetical protein
MARRLQLPKNERSQVEGAIKGGFDELGPRARVRDVLDWMNRERRQQLRWLLEAVAGDDDRLRKFVSRRRPEWRAKKEARAVEHGVGYFTKKLVQDYRDKNFDAAGFDLFGIALSGAALVLQAASVAGPVVPAPPPMSPSGSVVPRKKKVIAGPQDPASQLGPHRERQRTPIHFLTVEERPLPPPPSAPERRNLARRAPPTS